MNKDRTRTIAILGANGRLGQAAAFAFHRAGWNVRAVTRSGEFSLDLDVERVAGDMMSEEDAIRVATGCGFIFNGLNPQYTRWASQVIPMARNVIAAAHVNDAVHLFPGNVYNFGSQLPEILEESTPQLGDHRKAAIRIETEALFRKAADELDVQTIVLRAGDFFGGKGRGAWFDQALTSRLGSGKVVYPGPPDLVHAWAYLPDLATAFVRLAADAVGMAKFECFHFEGHSVTGKQMHEAIEQAMGRKLESVSLPWPVLRFGGLLRPMWREIWEVSYLWRRPHRLSGEKLEAVVGPLPHTPLATAVARSLDELGFERPLDSRPARALPTMAA